MITTIPAILALTACENNPLPQTTATFKDESATATQPTRAAIADFIFPEVNHEQAVAPPPDVKSQPVCYSTWDKPVCYDQPQRAVDGSMLVN